MLSIATMLSFIACRPAKVLIPDSLNASQNTSVMPVKGRMGLQIGQVISYGAFKTGKVKRGWTSGYDVPFVLRFQAAREKIRFEQFGPDGISAMVACVSKFERTDLPVISDFFSIPLKYRNYFAGAILSSEGGKPWNFVIYHPDGHYFKEATAGFAHSGSKRIDIVAIRRLEGQPDWMNIPTVYGFEFRMNGETLGAVSLMNKGEVRLRNDIAPETRLTLAALSTALLLRHNPEDNG